MRLFIMLSIIAVFLFAGIPSGISETGHAGKAFADSVSSDSPSSVDDDIPWPFGPDPGIDDEESEEEEEYAEEESEEEVEDEEPEESEENEEQRSELEEEFWEEVEPEFYGFYDDQSENNWNTRDQNGKKEPLKVNPDLYQQNQMSYSEWVSIPGIKVPYFFLIDTKAPGLFEESEPRIARFKALKYAGAILNGISFRYEARTDDVYLIENIAEVPELVFLINRTDYDGASKFEYETAASDQNFQSQTSGRRVVAEARAEGLNIADAYENARKNAFREAIRMSFEKERILRKWGDEEVVTGTVTAWEVLNDGWLADEEMYYLMMRFWITFD